MKTYPEILRDLREDRDYTQAQIAEVLGTTQQVYSRYENGINEMPVRHLRRPVSYTHLDVYKRQVTPSTITRIIRGIP